MLAVAPDASSYKTGHYRTGHHRRPKCSRNPTEMGYKGRVTWGEGYNGCPGQGLWKCLLLGWTLREVGWKVEKPDEMSSQVHRRSKWWQYWQTSWYQTPCGYLNMHQYQGQIGDVLVPAGRYSQRPQTAYKETVLVLEDEPPSTMIWMMGK